jgi:hypothetical protein
MAQTASQSPANVGFRAKVRMYRHGLGDCLLVTLPRKSGGNYRILIDCGVILGTADPSTLMTKVLSDVTLETNKQVDLLAATHEHWDHLSGFVQAADTFKQLAVGEVWLAWTEDPTDPLGKQLVGERAEAVAGLRLGANRMMLACDDESAEKVASLIEFFGMARGPSTRDALEAVRAKTAAPRYCKPADDPVEIADTGARIYVLGPPRDLKQIKKTLPSKTAPETYGLVQAVFDTHIKPLLTSGESNLPFGTLRSIPNAVAEEMDFFQANYWNHEAWRRIDSSWLDASTELALQLDSATNNTSLVLAIELEGGDVLLFAADAQVGNWESWQELRWTVHGNTVTGPDLLKRTVFYKVGHHGSHNATLRQQGLEMMDKLRIAAIPVDHAMAVKKRWGQMPLPALVDALTQKTSGALLRSDEPAPANLAQSVVSTDLFFEISF